jgi:uncharacterized protein YuzB (UPF0349 family)
VLSAVRAITKGNSFADLIQDLSDLSLLGKSNLPQLEHINFDLQKLDTANQFSTLMAKLLAHVNSDIKQSSTTVKIRNQAYTYLKESIDEIRSAGKYVFRNTPDRYIGYISKHRKS